MFCSLWSYLEGREGPGFAHVSVLIWPWVGLSLAASLAGSNLTGLSHGSFTSFSCTTIMEAAVQGPQKTETVTFYLTARGGVTS